MDFIATLVLLTNQARSTPLTVDKYLTKFAEVRAERACTDFSHKGFYEAWAKSPARYNYGGENLVKDFQTANAAHGALMASVTHKENILRKEYRRVGAARAKSCNAYAVIFSN